MFSFFKKTVTLPLDFGEFPTYTGKIKKGPIVRETPEYKRITYYVKGNIEAFEQLLMNYGFAKRNEVRYDLGSNRSYVIVEKEFMKYKIAYHKKK